MPRYLGVDYGSKRVGVAISDGLGLTARPLEVVATDRAVERVAELASAHGVDRLVVGLPTGLGGHEGPSAEAARRLAAELESATGLPVDFFDEKFTSRLAERTLVDSGMKRRERREKVDKIAAAMILQDYLDGIGRDGNFDPR